MHHFTFKNKFVSLRKLHIAVLALLICAGSILGILAATGLEEDFVSWMRAAPSCRLSIVNSLAVTVLPLCLSFIFVYSGHCRLLYVLCALYAFSWSYIGYLSIFVFGSGGWLVQALLMFSATLLFPVLVWFCVQYGSGERKIRMADCIAYLCIALVIAWVDYCYVSPFLAELMV